MELFGGLSGLDDKKISQMKYKLKVFKCNNKESQVGNLSGKNKNCNKNEKTCNDTVIPESSGYEENADVTEDSASDIILLTENECNISKLENLEINLNLSKLSENSSIYNSEVYGNYLDTEKICSELDLVCLQTDGERINHRSLTRKMKSKKKPKYTAYGCTKARARRCNFDENCKVCSKITNIFRQMDQCNNSEVVFERSVFDKSRVTVSDEYFRFGFKDNSTLEFGSHEDFNFYSKTNKPINFSQKTGTSDSFSAKQLTRSIEKLEVEPVN